MVRAFSLLLFLAAAAHAAEGVIAPSPTRPLAPSKQLPVFFKVPAFTLTDQDGKDFGLKDLKGPWIADFIFTRCSSQCPMMTDRAKRLAARAPGVRLVSFSLDARDTPQALKEYAGAHKADWTFLTGKKDAVRALSVDGFKLAAETGRADGAIAHSEYFVLVDGRGGIRGYYDANDSFRLEALVRDAQSLRPSQP